MSGEWNFKPGQEVFVYLSDKPNLFDDVIEKRIGKATITDVHIKQVKDLTKEEAKTCGAEDLSKEKELMCKFYNTDDNSTITYVKFNLEL